MNSNRKLYRAHYRAIGYTTNTAILGQELDQNFVDGFNTTVAEESSYPSHVVRLAGGDIDHGGLAWGGRDCCFVSFSFVIQADSLAHAKGQFPPVELLTRLADSLGTDETGQCQLELESPWELVRGGIVEEELHEQA